jgi:hypothetical protein
MEVETDHWTDLVEALENHKNAREDGSLNHEIVRALEDALDASR